MLELVGSLGEGGGQILRSSLALSMVLGKPFSMTRIRSGRKKPGLMQQHLTAVRAAACMCKADVQGAEIGSTALVFAPGSVAAGDYHFRIGTAGSATLVLQALLPGLLTAGAESQLTLEGGTHNPFAPPFDFLTKAFVPQLRRMGARIDLQLDRLGFYPQGGGRFTAVIHPVKYWQRFELLQRGPIKARRVRALVANLPSSIAERECRAIASETGWPDESFHVEEVTRARGPGNVVFVELVSEHVTELFTAFGQRGVPAEKVARRAWNEARQYIAADVPVGIHLADQLMLPLGIAAEFGSGGTFRTMELSPHSQTHIQVLEWFLEHAHVEVEPDSQGNCIVKIVPR